MLSYAHGASDTPLLGETIGANLERTVARVPGNEALVSCQQGIRLTYAELDEQVDRAARALLAGGGAPRELPELDFDDPINIQYTSGTTGFPKGATLSHHNILNNGFFVGELCAYTEADRVCIPVPFYHCFGMVLGNLACTTHGACMVIPAPAFAPEASLQAVQSERCTSLYGVP